MNKYKHTIAIFLLTFVSYGVVAQSHLQKGWDNFAKNEWNDARTAFSAALKEPQDKAEAALALCLISALEHRPDQAFSHFNEFYKSSADPYPVLFALWSTEATGNSGSRKKNEKILPFIESVINDPKANGTLVAMANGLMGSHYEAIGNNSKARPYFEKMGAITDWQLLGEFENISASGFDKEHDPLLHPEESYTFKNKIGAPVKWFNLAALRQDLWIDFSLHFYFSNSIIFAQTFCLSPSDQTVELRTGTSGSLKAWLNDQLVLTESEERNNDLDTYIAKVNLKKGYNRILLQIGESEAGRANFMVRITDAKGAPVSGLTFSKSFKDYPKVAGAKPEATPVFAEAYFEKKIAENPEKLLNYILLAETYLRNDKTYEARNVIYKAQKLAPESSYLQWQLIQLYMRNNDRTSLSMTLEKLKANQSSNPFSLSFLLNEAYEAEKYEDARSLISKLEMIYGESEEVMQHKIKLASLEKKYDDIISLSEKAYSQYPDNYGFVNLKYIIEKDVKKSNDKAVKVLNAFLKNNANEEAFTTLSNFYFSQGNSAKGFEYLEKLILKNPAAVGYFTKIGDTYFNMGNYNKAREYYEKALLLAPYVDNLHSNLGKVHEALKNKEAAIAAYSTCLVYNPRNYETRKSLRKLSNQPEIFSLFTDPDLQKLYKESPSADKYPGDNSLVIADEVQRVVYKGGATEDKHFLLVKVFNSSGIDDWKEYYIPYQSNQNLLVEKAEVIKKNGNKLKAEVNGEHIVFTALEDGDAIQLIYKLETFAVAGIYEYFTDEHFFKLFVPVLHSKYTLLADPGIKFSHKVQNSNLQPKVAKEGEFDRYEWVKENQKAIVAESYMPNLYDVGEVLHISSFPDWNFISGWYSGLAQTKAKSDFEVKEIVKDLFKDNTPLSDQAKARIIYDYIVRNIRYSSVSFRQSGLIPQKASKTLNTRMGDCKDVSTLFVAMCNEVGLKANLVLINSREYGQNNMALPSIDFNHCIAKVILDEKEYYVELTSDLVPFSSVNYNLKGALALEIKEGIKGIISPVFLNPETRVPNIIDRQTTVAINQKKIMIKQKNVKTGDFAFLQRNTYRNIGADARHKTMLEAISQDHHSVKLDRFSFDKTLESTSDSVTYEIEYTIDDGFIEVSDMMLFKLPFSEILAPADFLSAEERAYPIELWTYNYADVMKENIRLNLPLGTKLVEIPKSVKYSCVIADYSLDFKMVNNQLEMSRIIKFKKDYVPVENYAEFKKFYQNVVKADSKQLALK